jgi:mRNA-degrading endonuclease RelE of RelBE toxin-antitoxin system
MLPLNKIEWSTRAVRQLLKLETAVQRRVRTAVGRLATFPASSSARRLTSHPHDWRLRIGDYRVLFNFDGSSRTITIEEIRKRDERTY